MEGQDVETARRKRGEGRPLVADWGWGTEGRGVLGGRLESDVLHQTRNKGEEQIWGNGVSSILDVQSWVFLRDKRGETPEGDWQLTT